MPIIQHSANLILASTSQAGALNAIIPFLNMHSDAVTDVITDVEVINGFRPPQAATIFVLPVGQAHSPYYSLAIRILQDVNKVAQFSVPHDEGDPLFVCDATQQLASLLCPETEQLDRSLTVLSAEAESAAKSGDDFFDRFGFDWQEGYQMTLIAADINLAMARMAASHFAQQCTLPCTAYDPVEYSAGAYREVNIDHRVIFIDTPNYNKSRSRYIRREEKYLRDYIDHCYSISTDSPSSKANTLYLSAPREALLTPVVIAAALQSMINRIAAVTPQWVGKGVFQDFPVLGK